MRPYCAQLMLAAALLLGASPAAAEVLGQTYSDAKGTGTIQFGVDPKADPRAVERMIRDEVTITENGELRSVTVDDGVATLDFKKAKPTVLVEAVIDDDDVLAFILPGGGASPVAVQAGAAGLAATGLGFGIAEAIDEDDEDSQATGTAAQ